MAKTFKASKKSDDGAADKVKRDTAKTALASLVGKSYAKMNKAEQEAFIVLLGQMAGLLDAAGVVKALV